MYFMVQSWFAHKILGYRADTGQPKEMRLVFGTELLLHNLLSSILTIPALQKLFTALAHKNHVVKLM
jgi:hypothetical protein